MHYPIVILKDKDSDYGVIVPDLPGCFSAGGTVDEAMAMAREAIELHIEGLVESGLPVPAPSDIDIHARKKDFKGGTWVLVPIDPSSLRLKAKRINITMPERVLDAVDRFAKDADQSRSGLIVDAVTHYIRDEAGQVIGRTGSHRTKQRTGSATMKTKGKVSGTGWKTISKSRGQKRAGKKSRRAAKS